MRQDLDADVVRQSAQAIDLLGRYRWRRWWQDGVCEGEVGCTRLFLRDGVRFTLRLHLFQPVPAVPPTARVDYVGDFLVAQPAGVH